MLDLAMTPKQLFKYIQRFKERICLVTIMLVCGEFFDKLNFRMLAADDRNQIQIDLRKEKRNLLAH